MLKTKQQQGFTLVELAIVLVIIGLLIGGILKGQQLMQNSRVTATVSQIKGIEAATTNFRDVYGGLPGDLKNSNIKVPGCVVGNAVCDDANSDGSVGNTNWNMNVYQPAATGAVITGDAKNLEPLLFWYSLAKSGLISGVTEEAISVGAAAGTTAAFNKTIPSAKIGGGFWAGNSLNGDISGETDGRPALIGKYTLLGTVITLVKKPGTDLAFAKKQGPVTPAVAANIDRKLDDGLPNSGAVQAYGHVSGAGNNESCYGTIAAATDIAAYQENVKDLDCGVHIRIQQ